MINLGVTLVFIAILSLLLKRSFLNFIWSSRFFFTGLGMILLEGSKKQHEVVAVIIYLTSIILVFNLLNYIREGRENIEDIDSL